MSPTAGAARLRAALIYCVEVFKAKSGGIDYGHAAIAQAEAALAAPIETTAGVPISDEQIEQLGEKFGFGTRADADGRFIWFDGDPTRMIRAAILAASPVQKAEPSAMVCVGTIGDFGVEWNEHWTARPPHGTKLYATSTGTTSEREADRG